MLLNYGLTGGVGGEQLPMLISWEFQMIKCLLKYKSHLTFQVSETRYKPREGLETILSKHYTPEKLEMCFVQENTPELVNISQVVENQTEKSRDRNTTVNTNTVKAAEKGTEDISENIVSDTGDRSPRVFPSTKTSSSLPVKSLSFLHILNILILLVAFT